VRHNRRDLFNSEGGSKFKTLLNLEPKLGLVYGPCIDSAMENIGSYLVEVGCFIKIFGQDIFIRVRIIDSKMIVGKFLYY
jgi:hypothetical protein